MMLKIQQYFKLLDSVDIDNNLMEESFDNELQIVEILKVSGFQSIKKKVVDDILILLQLQHLVREKDENLLTNQIAKRIQTIYSRYRERFMDYISHSNYQQLHVKAKQYITAVLNIYHGKQLAKQSLERKDNQQVPPPIKNSLFQSQNNIQNYSSRTNLTLNPDQSRQNIACNPNHLNFRDNKPLNDRAIGNMSSFYDPSQSFLNYNNFNPTMSLYQNQYSRQNMHNANIFIPTKPIHKFIPQYNSQLVPNLRNLNQMRCFQQRLFGLYKNFLPKFQNLINNSTAFNTGIISQYSNQVNLQPNINYQNQNYNQNPRRANRFKNIQRQNKQSSYELQQPNFHVFSPTNQLKNVVPNQINYSAGQNCNFLSKDIQQNINSDLTLNKKAKSLIFYEQECNAFNQQTISLRKKASSFQPYGVQQTSSLPVNSNFPQTINYQNNRMYPQLNFYKSNQNQLQRKESVKNNVQSYLNSAQNIMISTQNINAQPFFDPTFAKCRCRGLFRMIPEQDLLIQQCKQCKHLFHLSCLKTGFKQQIQKAQGQLFICYQCQLFSIDPLNQVQKQLSFQYLQQPWQVNYQIKIPIQNIKEFKNLEDPNIQVQLRCSMLQGRYLQIESINWPDNCLIKINGDIFAQIKALPVSSNFKRRKDLPFNIKDIILRSKQDRAELIVTIQSKILAESQKKCFKINKKPCVFGAYITKKKSISQLQVKIKQQMQALKKVDSIIIKEDYQILEQTNNYINLTTEFICLNLFDPFTKQVIQTPVKGYFCQHPNCFDLKAFLSIMNSAAELNRNWKCPFCGKLCTKFIINNDLRKVIQAMKTKGVQLPKQVTYYVEQGNFYYMSQQALKNESSHNENDKYLNKQMPNASQLLPKQQEEYIKFADHQ